MEIPIFDMTLSSPCPSAAMRLRDARSGVTAISPLRAMFSTVSKAR